MDDNCHLGKNHWYLLHLIYTRYSISPMSVQWFHGR